MSTKAKLALGSILAAGGGMGLIVRIVTGKPSFQGPGDFILGFIHGIIICIGVVLVIFHLGKIRD